MGLRPRLYPDEISWMRRVPRPSTAAGTQKRREFIHDFLSICNPTLRLYVPLLTDSASITESSRAAATLTAVATPSYGPVGSGVAATLNGTSQYYTFPDAAGLTFGSGAAGGDLPFSLVALWRQSANTGEQDLMSKYDITTGATQTEYRLYLNAGKLTGECYDDSVPAHIGRLYNTALATGTWTLGGMSYAGSEAASGVVIYAFNGTVAGALDDTASSSGVYVGMENKTSLLYVGASNGAAAVTGFFNGDLALAALVETALDADDWQALRLLASAYIGQGL